MVQKSSKPRGRPRHFDADEALDKAVTVFWTRGYDGTTVDDLVAGTGVGRPSLYATFGDKETLFLKCLERYLQKFGGSKVRAFEAAPTAREAVGVFLRETVLGATADGSPRGCMMGSVAAAVTDPKVREVTVRMMRLPAQFVGQRLRSAVDARELPESYPCDLRARQVIDLAMGLALRARLGATREDLLRDAEDAVALFFPSA